MSGLRLAALFGFYPHQLGFCGSQEKSSKQIIADFLTGQQAPQTAVRKVLQSFRAAFPYYRLIAQSNGLQDAFDERVVRAYWLGNQLLEKVEPSSLGKMIEQEFNKPIKDIPAGARPHHSFHVLNVGPVNEAITFSDRLLDFCRIGWGRVKQADGKMIVEYQPLQKNNGQYFLAEPIARPLAWDKTLVPEIKTGDSIAFHWNHAIEVLNEEDLNNLEKYTQATINL